MVKADTDDAMGARAWAMRPEELDREELEGLGKILDRRPARLRGRTVGMALAGVLLRVRTREGQATSKCGAANL